MAIMETDRQGRIVLGKTYVESNGVYEVTKNANGVITLVPVVIVPLITLEEAFGKTGATFALQALEDSTKSVHKTTRLTGFSEINAFMDSLGEST